MTGTRSHVDYIHVLGLHVCDLQRHFSIFIGAEIRVNYELHFKSMGAWNHANPGRATMVAKLIHSHATGPLSINDYYGSWGGVTTSTAVSARGRAWS